MQNTFWSRYHLDIVLRHENDLKFKSYNLKLKPPRHRDCLHAGDELTYCLLSNIALREAARPIQLNQIRVDNCRSRTCIQIGLAAERTPQPSLPSRFWKTGCKSNMSEIAARRMPAVFPFADEQHYFLLHSCIADNKIHEPSIMYGTAFLPNILSFFLRPKLESTL